MLPLELAIAAGREERVHRGGGFGLVGEVIVRLFDRVGRQGYRAEVAVPARTEVCRGAAGDAVGNFGKRDFGWVIGCGPAFQRG